MRRFSASTFTSEPSSSRDVEIPPQQGTRASSRKGLVCQFEPFFNAFEAPLMLVQALAHNDHIAMN